MPTQRKIFRIEESAHADMRDGIFAAAPDDEAAQRHHELMTEVIALRALLSPRTQARKQTPETCGVSETCNAHVCEAPEFKRELDLIYEAIRQIKQDVGGLEFGAFISPKIERVSHELDAVIVGTEQATQNILKSAEDIDQIANTLSAMLKDGYAQGLAHDIRDHVVKVFEACNFQDITGQRINKVAATLKFIEDHIVRMMEIWRSIEQIAPVAPAAESNDSGKNKFINGPRLTGDPGHSSQAEIDVIFDSN